MAAGWLLVPSLVSLRAAFDALAPDRDRRSDGSVGDLAHQQRVSDHNPDETGAVPIHDADKINEVHALDVDEQLNVPGLTLSMIVNYIIGRCRAGQEHRLRYVIHDHTIWEASNGWRPRTYPGDDPHTEHAHFSASYDTAQEASTAGWHLEDIPVALTEADKQWISDTMVSLLKAKFERTSQPNGGGITSLIGRDALDQGVPNPIRAVKTPAWMLLGDIAEQVQGVTAALEARDSTAGGG